MKALILAGGRGKRLDEHTKNKNKCMVEVNGRSAISYSLDYAMNDNIDEIIITVGYMAEKIINCFGNEYKGKKISYAIQWERKGLVHAIECARELLDGDDFLLLLGDEVFLDPDHGKLISCYKENDVLAVTGTITVKDNNYIKKTYSLLFDDENTVQRLIEKPTNPLNNVMGTGSCVLSNDIFKYIEMTPVHHMRKEKELPDLIQCAIDDGKIVKMAEISKEYVNINMREDLHAANRIFD